MLRNIPENLDLGGERKCHSGFWWGNRPLGTPRRRWEAIQRVEWRGMDSNYPAHGGGRWLAVVNPVMNFRVPQNFGNFLTS